MNKINHSFKKHNVNIQYDVTEMSGRELCIVLKCVKIQKYKTYCKKKQKKNKKKTIRV